MTSLISIRLDDDLIEQVKIKAHALHLSQTAYIRQAIESMNHEIDQKERAKRMKRSSLRVRKDSMRINAEFSDIEHDPETE